MAFYAPLCHNDVYSSIFKKNICEGKKKFCFRDGLYLVYRDKTTTTQKMEILQKCVLLCSIEMFRTVVYNNKNIRLIQFRPSCQQFLEIILGVRHIYQWRFSIYTFFMYYY